MLCAHIDPGWKFLLGDPFRRLESKGDDLP